MGDIFSKSTSEDTNLETFSLIWLDATVNSSEENRVSQEKLRTSINHLKIFEDDKLCEDYIRDLSENDQIVLICSGRLGKQIVPQIHHLRQVFSIYIYCRNKQVNEEWANKFIKVQGVFVLLSRLIDRIRSDQDRRKYNKVHEQLSISIFNTKHLEKQWKIESNKHFIYSQVLIDCLLQMPTTVTEKNELISLCKTEYKENKHELKMITEFAQQYSSNQAIWWYTRESFLYKMLIKALRIQNINLLFLFRYVIHDIQCQLAENTYSLSDPVYRGQLMSKDELQMLKDSHKEFISINSFLSAIPDKRTALLFLTDAQVSNDIERVLFEIDVHSDLNNIKTFNNIQSKSYHNQTEILFFIGSIFQLIDIRLGENNIWIIQMTLCTNNHSQLKPIFKDIEEQYGNTKKSLLSFGLVLQKMNKFDEAEKYYQRLIQLLPSNHQDIIKCRNAIKTISIDKENYKKGLKSIEDYMETFETNDYHLALNHSNNGEMYRKNQDLDRALQSYNKALIIWKKLFHDDHQEVGRCYNKMGLIYQEKDEHKLALEYYQKAKIILEKYLSTNHPDLTTIYDNIGDMHQKLTEYDRALENYIKSLEIAQKIFTSEHSSVILLMNKIATVYEQKKDFRQALSYYQKIASLLPATHADFIKNKQNIERVSCRLN